MSDEALAASTLGDFFLAGRAQWRRDGQVGSRRWSSDDLKLLSG